MAIDLSKPIKPVEEGERVMSLMDSFASDCVMLIRTIVDDPFGGYETVWSEGVLFKASFEYYASAEIILAEKAGTSRAYRVYVDKTLALQYHDVFRRVEDGQIFRVTNDGTDRNTPESSNLDKRLIEVEKWVLPDI